LTAIAAGIALVVLAGLAGVFARPGSRVAARLHAVLVAAAAIVWSIPALRVLRSGESLAVALPWPVPGGALAVGLDPLSAFFLLPVAALSAVTACFGVGTLEHAPRPSRLAWPAFDCLVAAMLLVLVARNAVLFVVSWEVMSLAAWSLVASDSSSAEGRRAGWITLVAAHVGSAALLLLFAILAHAAGASATFDAIRTGAPTALPTAGLLVLGLLGFGVKAGVVPLHVWLPEAHAAAPSHVSALMSGAMVKLGLYGMLRLAVLLGPLPPGAGPSLAALGLVGALLGICLALQQRDLKRALAYSSVENLGLIAFGLGLAAWGSSRGDASLALFGLIGALLHVWNHAAMKGLLFLGAGAVLHAGGTRDLERLGGLLRRMPVTGACFALGAVAISGLPPLNAFGGEWLLYRGLLGLSLGASGATRVAACVAFALLALVGGLAVGCFVRLVGIAFLGEPRSPEAEAAREGGALLRGPLVLLAAACVALGVLPTGAAGLCGSVAAQILGGQTASPDALARTTAALAPIGALAVGAWLVLALGWFVASLLRGRRPARDATWSCGYAAPTPRMQYTARSFSELLAERLLPRALAPRVHASAPRGAFPVAAHLTSEEADPITRGVCEPLFDAFASRFARLRALQQGNAHLYLSYILAAILASLVWISLRARWAP